MLRHVVTYSTSRRRSFRRRGELRRAALGPTVRLPGRAVRGPRCPPVPMSISRAVPSLCRPGRSGAAAAPHPPPSPCLPRSPHVPTLLPRQAAGTELLQAALRHIWAALCALLLLLLSFTLCTHVGFLISSFPSPFSLQNPPRFSAYSCVNPKAPTW